jgi:hypothetical protein
MTIRYLIDTDWVIDHLNQIDRVVNRLKEVRPLAWYEAPVRQEVAP